MNAFQSMLPYLRRYKWRFAFGGSFAFVAIFIEVHIPPVVGDAINSITARKDLLEDLFQIGVYILALTGVSGGLRYLMRRVLIDTSRDIEFDYRNDIYRKLQGLDSTFYDNNSTGDIMSRMTNDIDVIRMMIGPAIMYSMNALFTLPLTVWKMFGLDWRMTLAGVLPMLALPPLTKWFGSRLHVRSREQQDQMSELTTYVQERLAGIRVVKATGQEESSVASFGAENAHYIDKSMKLALVQAGFFPAIRLIAGLGLLAILCVGARDIVMGTTNYGTLVAQIMLFGTIVWPMIAAGWVINMFQRAAASIDRVNEILDSESRVADGPTVVGAAKLPARLDVEVRGLTFTYDGATRPALRDIDLTVPAGSTLGIVGRVGSGKSTLVHLLLRLYPVERGRITIGGVDVNDWPIEELRKRAGIVFQDTFLFSDTIAENVRFGAMRELTMEEVVAAARAADVDKDIQGFPQKYDTLLGERGINLSGGQKQRLSIARALVRDADLLILDDCLSAVDTHTEETILRALGTAMEGRTTFLISHRISTVAMADQIIVLEDGAITQRGTHEELLAKGGLYAELYRKQLLEAEVEDIA